MLRMQADGLIQLPPSQNPQNGRRPPVPLTAATDEEPLLCDRCTSCPRSPCGGEHARDGTAVE